MKVRRAVGVFLFAAGCFGLGLGAARWLGWVGPAGGSSAAPVVSGMPGLPAPPPGATGPFIYIDAGVIELHDGALTIDPPPPPRIDPP